MAVEKDTIILGHGNDGSLIAEIAAYSAQIRKGNHRCSLSRCPHCDRAPESTLFFRRHAFRQRKFLVIEDRYVHAVEGLVARWRCPFCHRTFTEYPSFALPHKRYAVPQIAPKALDYVEENGVSYRKAVLDNCLPIFHWLGPADDSGVCADREPTLSHTTLYHWISALGNNTRPVPSNDRLPPRFMPVEWKFLTLSRRDVLLACRCHCRVLATPC